MEDVIVQGCDCPIEILYPQCAVSSMQPEKKLSIKLLGH